MVRILCHECSREISHHEPACPECGAPTTEGPFERHYESGQLMTRGTYTNGVRHGLYEEYYESGQLKEKCYFETGNEHGPFESYYENGQLEGKYNFNNGDPRGDGFFEHYNERGELVARGSYHASRKCGEWIAKGAGWSGRDKVTHYPPCPESQD